MRAIEEGLVRSAGVAVVVPAGEGLYARGALTGSRLNGRGWVSGDLDAGYSSRAAWQNLDVSLSLLG